MSQLEKNNLRKARDALDKFQQTRAKYDSTLTRITSLHDAIRPLISDITSPARDTTDSPVLKSDYSIPTRNGIITIAKNTPPSELKEMVGLILEELNVAGDDLERMRKDLESRHKFLKTISSKRGGGAG